MTFNTQKLSHILKPKRAINKVAHEDHDFFGFV